MEQVTEFISEWNVIVAFCAGVILTILFRVRKRIIAYSLGIIDLGIEGLFYNLNRVVKHSIFSAFTLRRYCRLLLGNEKYRYLHVPSSLDINLDIDDVYVTLSLDYQSGNEKKYNHGDILSVGNRIRVIGDPGSGKSSFVKKLLRDNCKQAISHPFAKPLPILFELRNLRFPEEIAHSDLGKWLYEHLCSEAERNASFQIRNCYYNHSETYGLLVLLDGLDEVSSNNYPKVQTAIGQLSQLLSGLSEKNTVILTMRTQFHQQIKGSYRDSFPHLMIMNPFAPGDIYEFLTRWSFRKNKEQNVARIYKELTDRPSLREMCRNPLILSMYVAEDQATGHSITPESRTEFYSKVLEELIIKRRQLQTGPMAAASKLREQRERILGRIAFEHMLNRGQSINSLSWNTALVVTQDILKCSKKEAEDKVFEIAKETGIISEEKPRETFRFIHLTFCEFLAAHEAVQGRHDGFHQLINAHYKFHDTEESYLRTRLIEVIPFACGLLPRVKRKEAHSEVAKLKDYNLVARCFLETKAYDHQSWVDFTQAKSRSLLSTLEENWDEQWLQELHLFNVVVNDAKHCSEYLPSIDNTIETDSFFRSLVGKQKESLSKLLKAYATRDAAATFRLAEICNIDLARDFPEVIILNCDQSPFLALVKEKTVEEKTRTALWASLLSIAALRSKAVAETLSNMDPIGELENHVNDVPRKKRWAVKHWYTKTCIFSRKSYLLQCLSIANGGKESSLTLRTIIDLTREIPAPGAFEWEAKLFLMIPIMILGFFSLSALILTIIFIFLGHETYTVDTAVRYMMSFNILLFFLCLCGLTTGWQLLRLSLIGDLYDVILQLGKNYAKKTKGYKARFSLHKTYLLLFGLKLRNLILRIIEERESVYEIDENRKSRARQNDILGASRLILGGVMASLTIISILIVHSRENSFVWNYELGQTLESLNHYERAAQRYERAIELDATVEIVYHNLGRCLIELGLYDRAWVRYKQLLILNPKDDLAYHQLGYCLSELGSIDEAISYYQKTIDLNPNSTVTYNNWSRILYDKGLYSEASEICNRGLAIDSNYVYLHKIRDLISRRQRGDDPIIGEPGGDSPIGGPGTMIEGEEPVGNSPGVGDPPK